MRRDGDGGAEGANSWEGGGLKMIIPLGGEKECLIRFGAPPEARAKPHQLPLLTSGITNPPTRCHA